MGRIHRIKRRKGKQIRVCLSICAVALVIAIVMFAVQHLEDRLSVKVENAGKQMTTHTNNENTAQVFMNGQWYQRKNVETLLVMGIDDFGTITGSGSYNNTHQADFLMLFIRDRENGTCTAIHLNRDTMANITMLGVTGEKVGTQYAQIALAFNYGRGQHDSGKNTVDAVSNLLYGIEIDHYIIVTMDAVPILNDWAGGVTVEVLNDMTDVDGMLAIGEEVTLSGEQALVYVSARMGLENSTNINRMERQKQYAAEWIQSIQDELDNEQAVADLMLRLDGYYFSNCTTKQLLTYAKSLSSNLTIKVFEIEGDSVRGNVYMEFHVDETALQQLVLEMFYSTVE